MNFVGLQNYLDLFTIEDFLLILRNTAIFASSTVGLTLLLSLGIALYINQKLKVFSSLIKSLILLPWAVPGVVNAMIWGYVLNGRFGILNWILKYQLGVINEYIQFLADPVWAFASVVFVFVWKEIPFAVLLLVAGLTTIPVDLYEAAKVDGANVWVRFRHITLPLMKTSIAIVAVLQTMFSLDVFDVIYILTRGGPVHGTSVISYQIYEQSFKFLDFGHGTAFAFVLTLLILVTSLTYIKTLWK